MAEKGSSVMWLRVGDEDIDAARQLRVQISKLEEGKGKKRRPRWLCWDSAWQRQNGLGLQPRAEGGE